MHLKLGALLFAVAAEALQDDDPLVKSGIPWGPDLLERCEPIEWPLSPIPDDDGNESLCQDNPDMALCHMARHVSSLSGCEEAISENNMCSIFPDAVVNFCCQSAFDRAECSSIPRLEEAFDSAVAISRARPYLPTTPLRRLAPSPSCPKPTILIFTNMLSICNVATTIWHQLGIVRPDWVDKFMDAAQGESLHERVEAWVDTEIKNGFFRKWNLALHLNQMRPRSEGLWPSFLTLPSNSLWDGGNRYVDRWGPPERFSAHLRNLQPCPTFASLTADWAVLTTKLFSGEIDFDAFESSMVPMMDDNFVVIDARKTNTSYHNAEHVAQINGFVTPWMWLLMPGEPTRAIVKENLDLSKVAVNFNELLEKFASGLNHLATALSECPGCIDTIWAQIVKSANHATTRRLSAHQSGSVLEEFSRALSTELKAAEALTAGNAARILFSAMRNVAEERQTSLGSIMESAILTIQALQNDRFHPTIRQQVDQFFAENLGCSDAAELRFLTEESTEDEQASRQLQPKRKSGNLTGLTIVPRSPMPPNETDIVEKLNEEPQTQTTAPDEISMPNPQPPGSVAPPDSVAPPGSVAPPAPLFDWDFPTDEPVSPASLETHLLPLGGYVCRDNFTGLAIDYFSPWIKRSTCEDLIDTFGCFGGEGGLMPVSMLLRACPESWMNQCRVEDESDVQLAQVLKVIDRKPNGIPPPGPITGRDVIRLMDQLSNPNLFNPLRQCIAQAVSREIQGSLTAPPSDATLMASSAETQSFLSLNLFTISLIAFLVNTR